MRLRMPIPARMAIALSMGSLALVGLPAHAASAAVLVKTVTVSGSSDNVLTLTATCPAGYAVTGGGYEVDSDRGVDASYPSSKSSWTVTADKTAGESGHPDAEAYARCQVDPDGLLSTIVTGASQATCPTGTLTGGGWSNSTELVQRSFPDAANKTWTVSSVHGAIETAYGVCETGGTLTVHQVTGADCPSPQVVLGGGFTTTGRDTPNISRPDPENEGTWQNNFEARDLDAVTQTYAECLIA
jgi:hypothetical protein